MPRDPVIERGILLTDPATGKRTLVVTIPMPPNKGNMRGSSRFANHRKKKYWRQLDERADLGCFPPIPDVPLDHCEAQATFFVFNLLDHTNAASNMKWPEDYLVKRKYLAADSPAHLTWTRYPEQIVDRHREGRMVIRIQEV